MSTEAQAFNRPFDTETSVSCAHTLNFPPPIHASGFLTERKKKEAMNYFQIVWFS
jgi:hypothetical protein